MVGRHHHFNPAYLGLNDEIVAMDHFGAARKAEALFDLARIMTHDAGGIIA
jgi:hypothetical protein